MHILVFNWRDIRHPRAGGAERYLHEMARRWVNSGSKVTWLTARFSGAPAEENIDGVRIVRSGNAVSVYICAALTYMRRFRGHVDRIVDAENGIPFFTPFFAREPVLALLFHVHVRVFRSELPWPVSELFVWIETRLTPLIYRHVRYVTISNTSFLEMLDYKLTCNPISIVHPGVETRATCVEKSSLPRVVCVGRLEAYKRVDVLLHIFARIRTNFPTIGLDVVGNGAELQRLQRLARELNVHASTIFHGFVTDQRKADILAGAWLFASTSSMEGWGMVVVEANAHGLPAVVLNVPGLSESVVDGESGFVVQTVEDFERAIIRLIDDADLRRRLGAGATRRAKQFGWDKSADTFFQLLNEGNDAGDGTCLSTSVTVGIPIFNEQANLPALLAILEAESTVSAIIAVDDGSTDASAAILEKHRTASEKLVVLSTGGGCGQLKGWRMAADVATTDHIVFIDADSLPETGAIASLVRSCLLSNAVICSGRVVPDASSATVATARFSASILHRVRAAGYPKETIIGRFFCADRLWFRSHITRDDIIANDTYLSVQATRSGSRAIYQPDARCHFAGATTVRDFASQRQRADAGYAQLRRDGLMAGRDEPPSHVYISALAVSALRDPSGAVQWLLAQARSLGVTGYADRGRTGTWTTQTSTKRQIEPRQR